MFTPVILKRLTAIAGACGALLAAAPASAFVYATSHLRIDNLNLAINDPNTVLGAFSFNLTNSAVLNGANAFQSADCGFTGGCGSAPAPVLNAAPANAPGSTVNRTDNNFTFLGTGNVNSYSGADSVIKTAQITQGIPTNIEQIAESLLNVNGSASANAEIQSLTSVRTTIRIVNGGSNLALSFLADPDQSSQITGTPGVYSSQSNMNATFTLTNTVGGVINWTPNGTGFNDCTISGAGFAATFCTETADTQDLNRNTATSSNPGLSTNSFEAGVTLTAFGINITGLRPDEYTIALNANTSTSIRRTVLNVAEPATTGLLGAAFLGLALTTMRRKRNR